MMLKRGFCITFSFLLIALTALSNGTNTSAASKEVSTYKKLLSNNKIKVGNLSLKKKNTTYAIKDLNHDGKRELILIHKGASYGDSSLVIATYYQGKVKVVYDDMWREDKVFVYGKGSVFYIRARQGAMWKSYYQIKKGKLVMAAYYTSDKGNDGSGAGYYLGKNNKEVSKKKFSKQMKAWTKGSKESRLKLKSV